MLQSTTPVLKVLFHYYSVLLRTTKYYARTTVLQSTTPYYKKLLQHYSVLQSTTPVLLCSQSTTPTFRAIDTHDLTKGLIEHRQDRNFTTVSCDRRVRSYERVALSTTRSQFFSHSFTRSACTILRKGCTRLQFYHSLARSTRTILRKGCISASFFRTMAPPPLITKAKY